MKICINLQLFLIYLLLLSSSLCRQNSSIHAANSFTFKQLPLGSNLYELVLSKLEVTVSLSHFITCTHPTNTFWVPLMSVGSNKNGERHTCQDFINPPEINKKKVFKNLFMVSEANFIYSAFLLSINIIKWWLSALFLTREIEFHELLMRLIFLRQEHWSVFSVVWFFFSSFCLVVVSCKGNV